MPWGPFAIFVDTDGNWFGIRGAAVIVTCLGKCPAPPCVAAGLKPRAKALRITNHGSAESICQAALQIFAATDGIGSSAARRVPPP